MKIISVEETENESQPPISTDVIEELLDSNIDINIDLNNNNINSSNNNNNNSDFSTGLNGIWNCKLCDK